MPKLALRADASRGECEAYSFGRPEAPSGATPCAPQPSINPAARLARSLVVASASDPRATTYMVLYTPEAASIFLLPDSIISEIDMALNNLVNSFRSSGINADVRVVSIRCTGLTGSYESGDLDSEVGQLEFDPQVKSWRDTDGADLVILWVKNGGGQCGRTPDLAINQIPIPTERGAQAFSILDAGCATANFSFAHELGHQMGALHDRVTALADGDTLLIQTFNGRPLWERTNPDARQILWVNPIVQGSTRGQMGEAWV